MSAMSDPSAHDFTPRRYATSPVDAVRIDASNASAVVEWLKGFGHTASSDIDGAVSIGRNTAGPGEWIVLTEGGHALMIDDELFRQIYAPTPIE